MSRISIVTGAALVAVAIIYYWPETSKNKEALGFAPRHSSLKMSNPQSETFLFKKSVKVSFDFDQKVIEQGFEGTLFLEWSGLWVRASLAMEGHKSDIYLEAKFYEDHTLSCISLPGNLTEKDFDYVLLVKSLLLDYAFKTNRDDNGDYAAVLSMNDISGGQILVTKSKSHYLDPEKYGLRVKKSIHEIKLKDSLFEASGEEQFELLLNGTKTAFTQSHYHLKTTQRMKRPILTPDRKLGKCTSDFSHPLKIDERVSAEEFKKNLLGMANADRNERHAFMRKINKLLRAYPEHLASFMTWVHEIKEDRKLASFAIGILGQLGTKEAQEELISLFKESSNKTTHLPQQVLNAFTLTSSPLSPLGRDFLKSQINGPRSHFAEGATYALGSSIQNDPESIESKKDLQFLLHSLEEAVGEEKKMVYLDALLNTGSEEVISVLEKYAQSENRFLSEKALTGLKTIDGHTQQN